jgi:nitrate reductase NapE component
MALLSIDPTKSQTWQGTNKPPRLKLAYAGLQVMFGLFVLQVPMIGARGHILWVFRPKHCVLTNLIEKISGLGI